MYSPSDNRAMIELDARGADPARAHAPLFLSASPELNAPAPGDLRVDLRITGLRLGVDAVVDFRQGSLGSTPGPSSSTITGCSVVPNVSPRIDAPRVRFGVDLRAGMRSEGQLCERNVRSFAAVGLRVEVPTVQGHVGVFAAGEINGRRPPTSGTPATRRQQDRVEAGAELVRVHAGVSERYAAAVFQARDGEATSRNGRSSDERGVDLRFERRVPIATAPDRTVDSSLTGEVQLARSRDAGPAQTRGSAIVRWRLEY